MPSYTASLFHSLALWSCTLTCLSIGLASLPAAADVITERKANFKANGAAMKAIAAAIGDGNRDLITFEAQKLRHGQHKSLHIFPKEATPARQKHALRSGLILRTLVIEPRPMKTRQMR